MNISPKIYRKLLTTKIEPDLFEMFKTEVGSKNMSSIVRGLIRNFLDNKEKSNSVAISVNEWMNELEKNKNKGLFNIKEDPLYNIQAFDFDGPNDLAANIDEYIYGDF